MNYPKHDRVWMNLVIGLLITLTSLVLFVMFDSFLFHLPTLSSVISPLQRQDMQNCAMTYSYPTFIKIDSPSSSFSKKYTLYLYREGYLDDPDKLYGVPALFIPGQAGSYKQIRSLASTTARKKQKIDFFTVDLNEELSALSGQTLLDQAEYMNSVVEHILSLYDTHTSSVIIIGHSMGGLIARTMFMLPNYVPNSVRTILTLATPHLSAPLLLDATIYKVYKDLTRYWRSDDHYKASLRDVIVISIAGGSLDNIIHSDGVNTASIIPTKHGFTTYTTSIPGVWTGVDHMAILWCNQLVRLLATTLLDIADLTTLDDRMGMLKYHLLEGGQYATIESQSQYNSIMTLNEFREANTLNEYVLFDEEGKHLILPNTQKWQFLTNIDKAYDRCWSIAFCKKPMNNSNDFHCQQTTPHVTVLPSATAENLIEAKPYRLLTVDSGEDYSHLAVIKHCQIVNTDETPFIKAYAIFSQSIQHTQSVWDIIWNGGLSFDVDSFYSLHNFLHIHNSLFAFDLHITSIKSDDTEFFKPMMQQRVHHQQEIKYYRGLESGLSDRITFHQENGIDKEEGLSLQFFVDNQTLHVELSFDWYGTLGRCVLRYGAILAQFLWISTSIILLTQLYSYVMNGKQDFIAFPEALVNCVSGSFLRFVMLLFIVSIIHYYYSLSSNYSVLKDILLGSDDWLLTGLLILAFGLSIGLTAFLWLVTSSLVFLLSLLPLRLFRCPSPNITHLSTKYYYFLCHLSIVIGLLAFLPSALVFIGYLLVWLFFTCSARVSCTLQPDMPSLQNLYKYRQSCLIFFISILPYYVPSVIVYGKDLLIGWTHYYRLSIITIIQDAPVLLALIYLVTIGSSPESLELRYLLPIIYIMNGIIIYQALFGFLHPFIISHFS